MDGVTLSTLWKGLMELLFSLVIHGGYYFYLKKWDGGGES